MLIPIVIAIVIMLNIKGYLIFYLIKS